MALPRPEPGLVICYSYLWHSEHREGREEGAKNRPCAVVVATKRAGGKTIATVVPITHTPPKSPDEAVELPSKTKARLALDAARSWVVVSEVNRFVWPSVDLRPISRDRPNQFEYGLLPPSVFDQIRSRLIALAKVQRLKIVQRAD